MKLDTKALFHLVVSLIPGTAGRAIAAVDDIIESNASKKDKAVSAVTASIKAINELAGTDLAGHPKFKDAVGKLNDAIVNLGRVAEQVSAAGE